MQLRVEPELLPIEVLHCGIGIFDLFCSCDLNFDPMTFIYKPAPTEIYRMRAKMNFLRKGFRKLSHYRHTHRETNTYISSSSTNFIATQVLQKLQGRYIYAIYTPPKLYTTPFRSWSIKIRLLLTHNEKK